MTDCCDLCGFEFPEPGIFWPFCPHPPLGTFSVQPDSIPGGQVLENLTPQPRRFDSRSEIRAFAKAKGLEQRVRHLDGSTVTTRWV